MSPTMETPMYVIKRDGTVKDFDISKIAAALEKAGKATGEFDAATANRITHIEVMNRLAQQNVATPTIEQIQDAVENALFDTGFRKTLRAYIVYREQRAKARDARRSLVDVESSMNEYLQHLDWRVNANANQGYSLGGLILNVSGKVDCQLLAQLSFITPESRSMLTDRPTIHIHDLDMLSGYCAGWSLKYTFE